MIYVSPRPRKYPLAESVLFGVAQGMETVLLANFAFIMFKVIVPG